MMVAELNYTDNFEFNTVYENGGRNYSTQIMLVLFMISVSILIMNLLITVAVNNTENLAERSELMLSRRKIDLLEEFTAIKKKFFFRDLLKIPKQLNFEIGKPILKSLFKIKDDKDFKVPNIILKIVTMKHRKYIIQSFKLL